MKKILLISGAVIAAAVLIYYLGFNKTKQKFHHFTKINIGKIERIVDETGAIVPQTGSQVKVGSRISGTLKKLYVKVGTKVKKDQIIAVIDARELKYQLENSLELLKDKKIGYSHIVENYQKLIDEASKKIKIDNYNILYLKKNLMRNVHLLEKGYIAQDAVDKLKTAFESYNHQKLIDEDEFERLKKEYKNSLDSQKTLIKAAAFAADAAKTRLSYAIIKSPINGVVTSVSTQEGETVAASFAAPTFVTILNPNKLKLEVFTDETDIANIKIGDPVLFSVDSYPDKQFKGKVISIDPGATIIDNVVYYETEVKIGAGINLLKPQMTANVKIITGVRHNVLLTDSFYVYRLGKTRFVYKKSGNKIAKQPVIVGWESNGKSEIKSGLSKGDIIAK